MINKLYTFIKDYIKENYGFLLIIIAIILLFNIRLPWSIYAPGGIISVDERLDNKLYNSKGSINLTYVTFIDGSIPTLLASLLNSEWDIVSNDDIKSSNEELIDAKKRNVIYLYESISNAIYNSYTYAGITPNITKKEYYIFYKDEKSKSNLKVGDKILKCNDKELDSLLDLVEELKNIKGKTIKIEYERNSQKYTSEEPVYEVDGEKKLGIAITTIYQYKNKPNIVYNYEDNEAGSSGGAMLALAYYNALTKKDITKGKKVCGTGTIDLNGNIGEIGGVKYKLSGAVKNKCDIFLVPESNYKEALKVYNKNNYKIKLKSVKTFEEMISYLEE